MPCCKVAVSATIVTTVPTPFTKGLKVMKMSFVVCLSLSTLLSRLSTKSSHFYCMCVWMYVYVWIYTRFCPCRPTFYQQIVKNACVSSFANTGTNNLLTTKTIRTSPLLHPSGEKCQRIGVVVVVYCHLSHPICVYMECKPCFSKHSKLN